jgi:hypothetical protein
MLIDGGGFGTITGNSFQIKQEAVTPSSVSGLTASDIEQMFSFLPDAGLVGQSGAAHTKAAGVLADIADQLVKHAQILNENWTGTAATSAISGIQKLHQTAIGLAQASAKTGAVLTWMASIIPYYKSYQAPALSLLGQVEAAFGDNPSDKAAQAVLTRFNNRLVQANDGLPPEVTKDLPTGGLQGLTPLSSGPGGGVPAGAAAASGTAPGVGGLPGGPSQGPGPGGVHNVGTPPGGQVGSVPGGGQPTTGTPPGTDRLASAPGGSPGTLNPGGAGTGGAAPPATLPGGSSTGGSAPVFAGGSPGDGPPGDLPGGPSTSGLAGDGGPGDPNLGDPALGDPALGDANLGADGGDVVGVAPGDSAVIGNDGMIGAGPGAPGGAGADAGF